MARSNSSCPEGQIKEFSRQLIASSKPKGRSYLTPAEVDRLLTAARSSQRYPLRNWLIVLLGYRHGLRVNELCDLQWEDIEFTTHLIYIRRSKGGICTHHRLEKDEIRALHRMQRKTPYSPFIFTSERGACISEDGIAKLIARLGQKAGFTFKCHPHQLRHACGYYLASIGVPLFEIKIWLGHSDISSTLRYVDKAAIANKSYWAK